MKIGIVSVGLDPGCVRLQPYRTILELAHQLVILNHEVVLLSDGASSFPFQDKLKGLRLLRLNSVRLFRGLKNHEFLQTVKQEAPDILLWHFGLSNLVHQNFHQSSLPCKIGILTSPIHSPREILRLGLKKLASDPRLVTVQLLASLVPGTLIRNVFKTGGLRGVITLSESTRQYLIKNGAPAERIWVLAPGVDQNWLDYKVNEADRQSFRHKFGFYNENFVVTYFGGPSPIRGLNTLILAFKQAIQFCPQLRLLILLRRRANEWHRQTSKLNHFIESQGLKSLVHVVDGFLEQNELINYVRAGDIVCLPFELVPSDIPLSILEAMALKQGVITTRLASITELIGNDRGFLIPPASVYHLAKLLQEVAGKPDLIRVRGQRGREYIEAYRTWGKTGNVIKQVLTTIYTC